MTPIATATAVVTAVNAAAGLLPVGTVATRRHAPIFRAEDLEDLAICVIPVTNTIEEGTRDGAEVRHEVSIVLQKQVGYTADGQDVLAADVDPIVELADAIARWAYMLELDGTGVCIEVAHDPVIEAELLQAGIATSIVTLTILLA